MTRHWVGLGATAAVVLALLAGGTATWWQAQRAQRRFDDVRKLAHTFMFDVHDAIEKLPGSTAARKLLVTEALAYLDRLASEAGGDASLPRELATGYEKMADVLGRPNSANLGDLPGALAAYRKAQAARERLLAMDPENREIRRDLSTTSMKLANVLLYTGDPRGGMEEAAKSSAIEEALAAVDKAPDQSFRLATSYTTHGYLLGASGRVVDSLDRLRRAIALLEPLEAAGWQRDRVRLQLAQAYQCLGDVLGNGGPGSLRPPGVLDDAPQVACARGGPGPGRRVEHALQRRAARRFILLGEISTPLGDQGRRRALSPRARGGRAARTR